MSDQQLYDHFERLALKLIAEGRDHWSSDALLHIIRFNTRLQGDDTQFKINNNLSAAFARRFVSQYPMHRDFFKLRRSKLDAPTVKFEENGQAVMF